MPENGITENILLNSNTANLATNQVSYNSLGIELDILIENVDKEQEQVGKPYQMRDRLKISIFRNSSMNCATSCSVVWRRRASGP
ncbi:unnamed protein product [Rhizophagus irregularis]|nr:unnamed protein product [Rhizophagus irregularis]